MKLGLYQKELFAVDGSKFRAVNSKDNTYNAEILEKKLKRIDEHIKEYLSQMDQEDQSEPDALTPEQVKAAIQELTERKEKYQEYLKELLEKIIRYMAIKMHAANAQTGVPEARMLKP